MQCSCGGSTSLHVGVRKKKFQHPETGKIKAKLEEMHLDVCDACGRVGRGTVYAVLGQYSKKLIARR